MGCQRAILPVQSTEKMRCHPGHLIFKDHTLKVLVVREYGPQKEHAGGAKLEPDTVKINRER